MKIVKFITAKTIGNFVPFYFDNKLASGLSGLVRDPAAMKRNGMRVIAVLKITGASPRF